MDSSTRNYEALKVTYEITDLAKSLEKQLNISWGLEKITPFDACFYLRLTSENPVTIKNSIETLNTGIYIELSDPVYEIEVRPYSNLIREKGLVALNIFYDFYYRNEIKVFMVNHNLYEVVLNPGDIIATLSFKRIVPIDIVRASQINPADGLIKTKDNTWVQEEKRQRATENTINQNYNINNDTIYTENQIKKLIEDRLK